jgi:hypothetical protein
MGELDPIKRIAEDVYQSLGSGYSEEVYDRAMQVGLGVSTIPGAIGSLVITPVLNNYRGTLARSGVNC